jgi:diamine N-acetyltransferase
MRFETITTDRQIAECAEVIRTSFATVAAEFGLTEENAPSNPAFYNEEKLRDYLKKNVTLHGLYDEARLVGCVAIEQSKDSGPAWYVERLAVLPGERHHGYGALLLEHAEKNIVGKGGAKVSLGIIDENVVLKDWYKRNGYAETGTKKFAHLPFRVCFMEKRLK